jgi:His-Xaa-Ser system radical SAM maturase HxsB
VTTLERFRARFQPAEAFQPTATHYQLAPFRFTRIPGIANEVLIVNELGEYHFLPEAEFHHLCQGSLHHSQETFRDLRAKHFVLDDHAEAFWPYAVSQYRTRKSFLSGGPALHIFVVTLRCEHSCPYCQVSRQTSDTTAFDMSDDTARQAVERLFEPPSPELKVEFQGGEPLLAFDRIRTLVETIERRNERAGRRIEYVIATTLNGITSEQLEFCRRHRISLSTSIDGPEELHNRNRPRRGKDSFPRTVAGIEAARDALGHDAVSALTTITRESLAHPEAIIDVYASLQFSSIFLRPLSPYGFARLTRARIGYSITDFLQFYERALAHLIKLNLAGTWLEETYATLLLQHILTPFPTGYVDLRSPTGAALGALVYNYDGSVYASDEGRMLAESGDHTFRLGTVRQSYRELIQSPAAQALVDAGVAESLPGCCDCAYLPYCGADPVFHHAEQGTMRGHRPTSAFCQKQTALFQFLFRQLRNPANDTMRVLTSWLARRPIRETARTDSPG